MLHAATGDITDAAAVAEEVSSVRPDACIHLAAIAAIRTAEQDPDAALASQPSRHPASRTINSGLGARVRLLPRALTRMGVRCKPNCRSMETALLAPMSSYAATKAAADLALGAMAGRGLRVVPHSSVQSHWAGSIRGFRRACIRQTGCCYCVGRGKASPTRR